jgi:hypothetical protein
MGPSSLNNNMSLRLDFRRELLDLYLDDTAVDYATAVKK